MLSTDAHGNKVVVSTDEEKAKALGMHLSGVFTIEDKIITLVTLTVMLTAQVLRI